MGCFNVLIHEVRCRQCAKEYVSRSQFKYGELWDYEYVLGQQVRLCAEDDAGDCVVAELLLDNCPACGDDDNRQLLIEGGVATRILDYDEHVDLWGGSWTAM